jgi:ribosomal peptide maturation radical SAM protein 1
VTGATPRVLLVSMPWANPQHPILALGLFKAALGRAGLECDTLYANVRANRFLGDFDTYSFFSLSLDGDLVYTPHYFGVDPAQTAQTLSARVAATGARQMSAAECRRLIDASGAFLDDLFASVDWDSYDLVGFSLMFQQLCASLSLARRIKARYPDKPIVFGGATCEADMGREIARAFTEVDFVSLGESDHTFVPLVRELLASPEPARVRPATPGVAYRLPSGEVVESGGSPPIVHDMDALPIPDYDDYFALLTPQERAALRPVLYMECSRGCWWGEKSLCTFCGLNGSTIAYRRKSPARCVEEIRHLADRYGVSRFFMADNILDHRAFKTFLKDLAALRTAGYDLHFFFEIKSNVSREHVRELKEAGVDWVQPGIESFSDHVLQMMRKGVTGIQQVQLLKFLAEFKIRADWNILYANPGERPEDYDEIIEVIPFLYHLPPPAPWALIPVAMQRFNQYFEKPSEFGITALRPAAFYRDTLPRTDIRLDRLAYHFDYEHPDREDPVLLGKQGELLAAVERWRQAYKAGTLTWSGDGDEICVVDRRGWPTGEGSEIVLRGLQAGIYMACMSARQEQHLLTELADRARPADARRFIDLMVERRLMFRSRSGRVLSLALQKVPTPLPGSRAPHAEKVPTVFPLNLH